MSYEIVKGLKIDTKKNQVWIKCDSNNVFPKNFRWHKSPSLSRMLEEKGKKEVEKVILREYWGGNFQKSNNIYDKTVQFYKSRLPYTWDNVGVGEESIGTKKWGDTVVEYTEEQLKEALYDCLMKFRNRDLSKTWVIRTLFYGGFVYGKTKLRVKTVPYGDRAKKFKSFEEASIYWGGDVIDYDTLK